MTGWACVGHAWRSVALLLAALSLPGCAEPEPGAARAASFVSLGPRPAYLADIMPTGALRDRLTACQPTTRAHPFSIAHRGAPLMFAEHTEQSYRAAARMGAGRIECDVSFTSDAHLVCRHSECDLHRTTNILRTELAAKCSVPWGGDDEHPGAPNPQSVRCCTSDLTLAEYKSLRGRMDGANPTAQDPVSYERGTPAWRTDLYQGATTLMSHRESIELIDRLGADFIPELKPADPVRLQTAFDADNPEQAQDRYAQQLLDDYASLGIAPDRVWPQSFQRRDIEYWIAAGYAERAIYLLRPWAEGFPATAAQLSELRAAGIRIIAPPIGALLVKNENNEYEPSSFAQRATAADLQLITWSLERSDPRLEDVRDGVPVAWRDHRTYDVVDTLANAVGVTGIFSDWPATVTHYANCMLPATR